MEVAANGRYSLNTPVYSYKCGLGPLNKPKKQSATYEDLLCLPDNVIGEILAGELHTQPSPSPHHSLASTLLTTVIADSYDRSSIQGPCGWWILSKPECHLCSDIVVPDIAGWRQSTLPELPETAWIDIRSDWVCEVLSPSTAQNDRVLKRLIYAREGVGHYWIVNPIERILEAFAFQHGSWVLIAALQDDNPAAIAPFEQLLFDLGRLWA